MKRVFKKPYIYFFIIVFLFYFLINLFISGFNDTIPLILKYASTVNWFKLIVSLILSLIIGILVSINVVLVFVNYRERKKCKKEMISTGIGVVGGLITGFCPLCVAGLFPLLFGLFGVSFSLASLPFQGIEVQIAVVILLFVSLRMLNKNVERFK